MLPGSLVQSGDEGNEVGSGVALTAGPCSPQTGADSDWKPWKAEAPKLIGGQHFHVHIPPSTGHVSASY